MTSYDELLADPMIEAGKHVLCEKPIATSAAQAHAMYEAARSRALVLVEGYPYMVQPQTLRLRKLDLLEARLIGAA